MFFSAWLFRFCIAKHAVASRLQAACLNRFVMAILVPSQRISASAEKGPLPGERRPERP